MSRGSVYTLAIGLVSILPSVGQASFIHTFERISNNAAVDVAAQLAVELEPVGAQVKFTFTNTAVIAASITDVYFADGTLLGIATITSSPGVDFSQFASPSTLPGGSGLSPPFITTAGFSADSNPPVSANGVDAAQEWLAITFDLQAGKNLADVIDDIETGRLRIGMHVQSISTEGESDSFVNTPEPGAAMLGLAGLTLLNSRRRRENR